LTRAFFASDLHAREGRYEALFCAIAKEKPDVVFLGGDLLPSGVKAVGSEADLPGGFVLGFLADRLSMLRRDLGTAYPEILVIMGNDDIRVEEPAFKEVEGRGLWHYVHNRKLGFEKWDVYGYSYVTPTPFLLKDWERYDVSRYVDPGCMSPEEGSRTVQVSPHEAKYSTIKEDLDNLVGETDLSRAVFLFHSPPHNTRLDRAAMDGKTVEGVPVDVHVGSIAIRRFIEARQPMITLHGHVHESARLTGTWQDRIGRTLMFSAAHDGPELALVSLDLEDPSGATRRLL
jgi:Icc-related predicted phosphoesterase